MSLLGAAIAVGTAIAGAVVAGLSTIGGVAVSAGVAISAFAKMAVAVIATRIPDIVRVLKAIEAASAVIQFISEMLGKKMEDDPEELGYKAMHAEKKKEDFDDIDEYIDYLNNEIQIDKEEMKKMTPEEKAACQVVGSAIQCVSISKELGINIEPENYADIGLIASNEKIQSYLGNTEEMSRNILKLITALKEYGVFDLKEVDDYLNNKGDFDQRTKTGEALMNAIDSIALKEDTVTVIQDFSNAVQESNKD